MIDLIEPEENVLETLKNVRDAYEMVLKEQTAESRKLHDELDAKYAPVIASCLSVYYETVRKAHDAGFSTADMETRLNTRSLY